MQNKNTRILSKTNTNRFQHRNDFAKSHEANKDKVIVTGKDDKIKFQSFNKKDTLK